MLFLTVLRIIASYIGEIGGVGNSSEQELTVIPGYFRLKQAFPAPLTLRLIIPVIPKEWRSLCATFLYSHQRMEVSLRHIVPLSGVTGRHTQVYPRCVPWCIPPYVYPVYTSLCVPGVYLPIYTPCTPWVYHHTTIPGLYVAPTSVSGPSSVYEALGSREEKPMGKGGLLHIELPFS